MKWWEHLAWLAAAEALAGAFATTTQDFAGGVPGILVLFVMIFAPAAASGYCEHMDKQCRPDVGLIASLDEWFDREYNDRIISQVNPLPGHGEPYQVVHGHGGHTYHKYRDGRMVYIHHSEGTT